MRSGRRLGRRRGRRGRLRLGLWGPGRGRWLSECEGGGGGGLRVVVGEGRRNPTPGPSLGLLARVPLARRRETDRAAAGGGRWVDWQCRDSLARRAERLPGRTSPRRAPPCSTSPRSSSSGRGPRPRRARKCPASSAGPGSGQAATGRRPSPCVRAGARQRATLSLSRRPAWPHDAGAGVCGDACDDARRPLYPRRAHVKMRPPALHGGPRVAASKTPWTLPASSPDSLRFHHAPAVGMSLPSGQVGETETETETVSLTIFSQAGRPCPLTASNRLLLTCLRCASEQRNS